MIRLDLFLVNKQFVTSREKAKELIKSGKVFIDNKICIKPSMLVNEENDIIVNNTLHKYVGRGGLKLEKAINAFEIDLNNKICADIGASTGGFTDCMLINEALRVYAVDVGHDQLAEKLLENNKVINLEGINVRYLTSKEIPEKLDFISVDVSFISLKLIIPVLKSFLKDNGDLVCLIKPQFEVGKVNIGKHGIVKSKKVHIELIHNMIDFFNANGLFVHGFNYSPIKGSVGNIEYLIHIRKQQTDFISKFNINNFVLSTFKILGN